MLLRTAPGSTVAPTPPGTIAIRQSAAACLVVLVAIKLLFLLLDPHPQFFMGDSGSYIWTSIDRHYIPLDRSYSYGFAIRILTRYSHSFSPLIVAQIMASLGTAVLVYHMARTYFKASQLAATLAACCFALDPMQLYYERAVLTEAFSTCVFALMLNLSMNYLARPAAWKSAVLPMWAVLLISLRIAMMVASIGLCLLPPLYLLGVQAAAAYKAWRRREETGPAARESWKGPLVRYAAHLGLAAVTLAATHYGYRHLTGRLAHREPAYLHRQGIFLLAGVIPLIGPEDAPDPRFAEVIENYDGTHPLDDPASRGAHLFLPGGLIARLQEAVPDQPLCNELAAQTARHAILRSPARFVKLAIDTWRSLFSPATMKTGLISDEGGDYRLPGNFLKLLADRFTLAATPDWGSRMTVTKWLHMRLRWWYYLLLTAPLLSLAAAAVAWKRNPPGIFLLVFCAMVLLVVPCASIQPSLRHFHSLGVVIPMLLALVMDRRKGV